MNANNAVKTEDIAVPLIKQDPSLPALKALGRCEIVIPAGLRIGDRCFAEDVTLPTPDGGYEPGCDYAVLASPRDLGIVKMLGAALVDAQFQIGGFHFAPGGNAAARSGGDDIPAINPYSIWDLAFRPACADPRGMTFDPTPGDCGWDDIYFLGKNHLLDGTSRFGVTIADGDDPPANPAGGYFRRLDYDIAVAVYRHHGKRLLTYAQFIRLAHGVTERSAAARDPKVTGLDAARTSQRGAMQATGNLWVWGTDGHPDDPPPSLFGGSWLSGSSAGSRYAYLDYWPEYSFGLLGARGRSDHLQLG